MALLNNQGQDVTNGIIRLQRANAGMFKKNREAILSPLREVLVPSYKHSHTTMFQLGERAVEK